MVEATVVTGTKSIPTSWRGLLAAALAAGCGRETAVVTPPPAEVSISQPLIEPVRDTLEFTGRASAVESVELHARVTGYITKVAFTAGALVKVGDLLFEIDPREYHAAVLRAEGDVARLRAQLARAESEVARNQALRPSGAASGRDLERAIAEKGAAEGELKSKLAQLELAQLDLEFTRVTAPIAGRVSRAEITEGNLVMVGATGGPLLTSIVSVDPIYVDFDADERSLLRVRKAAVVRDGAATPENLQSLRRPVFVGLADERDTPYEGIIESVDNRVDPSTGTIRVRAQLPNPTGLLTPGLFVRVRVPIGEAQPTVLLTDRAVGTDQDRKFALVVNDKNVVEYRPIQLGPLHGDLRVVTEGLTAQDWVIVNGLQRARPGATVAPQKVAMRPGAPAAAPTPKPAS